jgi:hypothetical protein
LDLKFRVTDLLFLRVTGVWGRPGYLGVVSNRTQHGHQEKLRERGEGKEGGRGEEREREGVRKREGGRGVMRVGRETEGEEERVERVKEFDEG